MSERERERGEGKTREKGKAERRRRRSTSDDDGIQADNLERLFCLFLGFFFPSDAEEALRKSRGTHLSLEKEALADSSEEKGGAGKGLFLDGGRAPKEVVCQRKKPKRPAKGKEKRKRALLLLSFSLLEREAALAALFASQEARVKSKGSRSFFRFLQVLLELITKKSRFLF